MGRFYIAPFFFAAAARFSARKNVGGFRVTIFKIISLRCLGVLIAGLVGTSLTYAEGPADRHPIFARLEGFKVGSHRAMYYSSRYARNSLEAFGEAIANGVDIIETDVNLSKDGVVYVIHSNSMDKDTDCKGMIADKTSAEVDLCRFNGGQKIGRFDEALALVHGRILLNVEFKSANVITPAIDLIRKHEAYGWVYFQTTVDKVKYAKARGYDAHVALLYAPQNQEQLEWALALNDENLVVIELQEEVRSKANINRIHAAGKLTSENSWHESSNDERFGAKCKWIFEMGINIAITNQPQGCVRQRDQFIGQ